MIDSEDFEAVHLKYQRDQIHLKVQFDDVELDESKKIEAELEE